MGNAVPRESISFLLDTYNLVQEQELLKILQQKQTGQRFALKEQCFANRHEYDRSFKRLASRNNCNQCDNILQMVKMWSKEHNGICSNIFQIYTVYEHPKVRLIDQIEARNREKKMFQEGQLFSILQSCLNALTYQPQYSSLSPHIIFILPEGVLKLCHPDLLDPHARTMYSQYSFYSPEKIEAFQRETESVDELQKQAVFSLGMTLLHSALLKSPNPCYQLSLKKFNTQKLDLLLDQIRELFSPVFYDLMRLMLTVCPDKRGSLNQVQGAVEDYLSRNASMYGSRQSSKDRQSINKGGQSMQMATHQLQDKFHDFSLIYSGQTFHRVSQSSLGLQSAGKQTPELDLVLQSHTKQMPQLDLVLLNSQSDQPRNHHVLRKNKKIKTSQPQQDKQNIYTDPKLINLIRSGMSKISKTQQPSYFTLGARDSEPLEYPITQSQNWKDPFGEYELSTQHKEKCTFVSQTYGDRSYFQGMMEAGMKNGYGKLTYPDGVYYEGSFKNDTLEGKGSLFYGPGKAAYVGDWRDNQFDGQGTLYNQLPIALATGFDYRDFNRLGDCWVKYEGGFVGDIKQGWGQITLTNGEVMQGPFHQGLLNGQCIYTTINRLRIEGVWKNNLMILN